MGEGFFCFFLAWSQSWSKHRSLGKRKVTSLNKSYLLFSFLSLLEISSLTSLCGSLSHQSVQFSRSVVSDSLRPHESQHARPPCPSQTPGVYSNSCPLSRWCHPTISSSVIPFSTCPQSLAASGSFPMSHFFTWGGHHPANLWCKL